MAGSIKEITDKEFDATIADGVTLVDFWAPWCGPCRMQGPVLEEVAAKIGDGATIAKVNVDGNQEAARRFGVRGIPTLILFKDGEAVQQLVGLQTKEVLMDAVSNAVGANA